MNDIPLRRRQGITTPGHIADLFGVPRKFVEPDHRPPGVYTNDTLPGRRCEAPRAVGDYPNVTMYICTQPYGHTSDHWNSDVALRWMEGASEYVDITEDVVYWQQMSQRTDGPTIGDDFTDDEALSMEEQIRRLLQKNMQEELSKRLDAEMIYGRAQLPTPHKQQAAVNISDTLEEARRLRRELGLAFTPTLDPQSFVIKNIY